MACERKTRRWGGRRAVEEEKIHTSWSKKKDIMSKAVQAERLWRVSHKPLCDGP